MDASTPLRSATVEPASAMAIARTPAAGEATADDSPVLHAAIGLAEQIRAASDEIERGRQIPLDALRPSPGGDDGLGQPG